MRIQAGWNFRKGQEAAYIAETCKALLRVTLMSMSSDGTMKVIQEGSNGWTFGPHFDFPAHTTFFIATG